MATNNSVNMGIQENADGGQVKLGVTQRILKWLGADITLTGSGSNTHTFPATSSTLLSNQAAEISALTEKTTLVDDDLFIIEDSAASNAKKKVKKSNVGGVGGGDAKTGSNGLLGVRNSTTPNTKIDFSANMVALRNPSTSLVAVRTNTGTITCDITLPASGSTSTANGCDQSKISALTSQWVHFYWIWNGTTLATLASLTAPPTGPTLPSGYTHWAYIGAWRLNSSSQLMECTLQGDRVSYTNGASETPVVNATNATTEQTASVSGMVPPNALLFGIEIILTVDTGSKQILLKYLTGKNYSAPQFTAGTHSILYVIPAVSQQFFWNWNGAGGTFFYVTVNFFTIPNGST